MCAPVLKDLNKRQKMDTNLLLNGIMMKKISTSVEMSPIIHREKWKTVNGAIHFYALTGKKNGQLMLYKDAMKPMLETLYMKI